MAEGRSPNESGLDSPELVRYSGAMKNNRRPQKSKKSPTAFPTAAKGRWLPDDTTRPVSFPDRRAVASKKACRGKVAW
jgi:hypothetical protein